MARRKFKNFQGMADVIQHLDPDTLIQVNSYALVLFACQEKDLPPVGHEAWQLLPDAHQRMFGELAKAWLVSSGKWLEGLPK